MRKFKLYIDNFSRRERLWIDDGRTMYDRSYDILPENGKGSLSYDEVINILRKCETNSNKVFYWEAPTFLADGLQWERTGTSIEELEHRMKKWKCDDDGEPFMEINVRYINSETKKYSFEIAIVRYVNHVNYSISEVLEMSVNRGMLEKRYVLPEMIYGKKVAPRSESESEREYMERKRGVYGKPVCYPWKNIVGDIGVRTGEEAYHMWASDEENKLLKIISIPQPSYVYEQEDFLGNDHDKDSINVRYESKLQNYKQRYQQMKVLQGVPQIVRYDGIFGNPYKNRSGGEICIVSEDVKSLDEFMADNTFSEEEIIKLGKDILQALISCEEKEIIHGKIGPENIMVAGKKGAAEYKLGDFGNAPVAEYIRRVEPLEKYGQPDACYSVDEMVSQIGDFYDLQEVDPEVFAPVVSAMECKAPEVVHGEKYGHAADIYSLGMVMYWLLNNQKIPFIGADEQPTHALKKEAMERRYRGEKLPAPENGSRKLAEIVLKACEYKPEDRYVSAQEMYDALEVEEEPEVVMEEPEGAEEEPEDAMEEPEAAEEESEEVEEEPEEVVEEPEVVMEEPEVAEEEPEVVMEEPEVAEEESEDIVKEPKVQMDGGHLQNHAEVEAKERKFSKTKEEEAEGLLSKIEVEKLTAKNVIRTIIYGMVACGIAMVILAVGSSVDITVIAIIGLLVPYMITYAVLYWLLFRIGEVDFLEWMKANKEKIKGFDKYIKTNPEFARRLYYEKCRKKYLLEYMNRLNPDVVKSIKDSKRRK